MYAYDKKKYIASKYNDWKQVTIGKPYRELLVLGKSRWKYREYIPRVAH